MNEGSREYENNRIENIKQARNIANNMPESIPEPFEAAYSSLDKFLDEELNASAFIPGFGQIKEGILNVRDEFLKVNDPVVRRKILDGILIAGTALFTACQKIPVKNPEDFKDPTPSSQLIDTDENTNNDPSIVIAEDYTATPEITNTPTEIPTLTPTPTEYLTPTPTIDPAFTDRVFFFETKMKEGDLVWSVLQIEDFVNAYEDNPKVSFAEYISQIQKDIEGKDNYERVYATLEDIKNAGELTDLKLVQIFKNNFSELDVVDIDQWPEESIDLIPEDIRERLDTKEFDIFDVGDNLVGGLEDQFTHLVHIGVFRLAPKGSLVFDLKNYYNEVDNNKKVDLLLTVGNGIDEDGQIRAMCITLDENGKIKNVTFNGEYSDYYSKGPAWFIISNQDPFGMPTFND